MTVLLLASSLLALVLRRHDGRTRSVVRQLRFTPEDLRSSLGTTATFVQFSTSMCAPCGRVRRALRDLAGSRAGLAHVEVDAESRLDLVRRHRVLSTPTVFVLDGNGRVRQRLSGVPDRSQLHDALAALSSTPTGTEVTNG